MRIAILDIGSFSVRLLVAEVGNHRFRWLWSEGQTTNLAEGLSVSGSLADRAIQRTEEVLRTLALRARGMNVERLVGLATAALRSARNREEALARFRQIVPKIVVLSPRDEAELAFLSVRKEFHRIPEVTVLDLGGGSLQVASGGEEVEHVVSLPIGVATLTERFHAVPPVSAALAEEVDRALEEEMRALSGFPVRGPIFALGGTMSILCTLETGLKQYSAAAVHGFHLSVERLRHWRETLGSRPLETWAQVPYIGPSRARVLWIGTSILLRAAEQMGAEFFIHSVHGIRYGLVYRILGNQGGGGQ